MTNIAQSASAPAVFSFESHSVRTIDRDGEIWFVANDVCAALDIANPRHAISRLDDDEKGAHLIGVPGKAQNTNIINESGLYSLILRSRKAEAKRFKKWVTSEVLPAIRKTGRYGSDLPMEQVALAVRTRRFMMYFDETGQMHLSPIPKDAAILSPDDRGSMTTLMREYIPIELLPELIKIGVDRLETVARARLTKGRSNGR